MPSTNSSSMPKVFDSSTVTVPSLPTLSMASARISPMAGSAAEIEATWAISLRSSTSLDWVLIDSTAALTALSMPFFSAIGLAPAVTFLMPSRTSAWARTVAVVVPSPATSFVLVATSFTSWAPMFSKGFSSSTSLAMVTPSLVMVGAPNFFSSTTLRPRGPSVTLTASASLSTPFSRSRRAASSNCRIFGIWGSLLLLGLALRHGQHVAAGEDQQVLAVDGDLRAAVLAVDDGVAHLDVGGNEIAALLGPTPGAHGEDLAELGLLLGRVGNDDAADRGLLGLVGPNHDA